MKESRFAISLLFGILLFAIVGAFARIMTFLNHNEHMYIAAGVLVAQGQALYRDFAYLQTPYLPLLYGSLFKLLGVNSYYLLTGKLISFILLCISSSTVFLIARRALNTVVLSLGIAALFLLNMTIVQPAAEVSNYIMPVAFSMLGFYVFVVSAENKVKPFGIALAGFFLAIAIGTKLTYAALVLPFVGTILLCPLSERLTAMTAIGRIRYVLFPFFVGMAIGLLPTFFFLSDLELFLFNNLGYHIVNAQWRQITGYSGPMSPYSKLVYAAREIFFRADNLIILLGILLGLGFSTSRVQQIRVTISQVPTGACLAFFSVLTAIPTALAPTPSFHEYFAMPVSFLFPLLAYSLASISAEMATLQRRLLFILVMVTLAYSGPHFLKSMSRLTHRDGWTGLYVHDVSMKIRNTLGDKVTASNHRIATLSPLFVIESNLPIYSELSTGPFLYRVGDLLSPEERDHFVGTSPQTIADLFHTRPPVAILVGFEGRLDKPLIDYATSNGYVKVNLVGFDGDLYILP